MRSGRSRRPLVVRFWMKVRIPLTSDGIPCDDPALCWEWTGTRTGGAHTDPTQGYGSIRDDAVTKGGTGRLIKVHRLSFLWAHGLIPDGYEICHACDNIICVNPTHLFAAPHKANVWDYIRKHGAICRPKSLVALDQLTLILDEGERPLIDDPAAYSSTIRDDACYDDSVPF